MPIKHELQLDDNYFGVECFSDSPGLVIRIGTEEGGITTRLEPEEARELLIFIREFAVQEEEKHKDVQGSP